MKNAFTDNLKRMKVSEINRISYYGLFSYNPSLTFFCITVDKYIISSAFAVLYLLKIPWEFLKRKSFYQKLNNSIHKSSIYKSS